MSKASYSYKKRTIFILIIFLILFLILFGRMFYWQVIRGEELSTKAYAQQTKNSIISPKRGTIYDCNGVVLAKSISVETISVTPKNVKNKEKTAEGLARILNLDYDTVLGKISKDSTEEVIAKKQEKEVTDQIRSWISEEKISGINIYEDTKRYYPKGSFLSQVLGFCGTDNQGLEGIEAKYENILKGVQGRRITSKDATGNDMPLDDSTYIPSEDGSNLYLTIDERIQYIVEKYLEQAIEDNYPVDYGTCIVMNPKNGDILAMATAPDYDPNSPFTPTSKTDVLNWSSYTQEQKTTALQTMWRNRCVSDTYEPGSVFKTITASIAIEEGIVKNVDAVNYNCNGYLKVDEWNISCWRTNPHGKQSLRQGLMNSCNPVYMSVALSIGAETFYDYLEAYEISKNTNSGLLGEVSGIIHDKSTVTKSTLATAGFGQGFTLTPLNMLNAICAIGNGGNLMQPHIIKQVTDSDGNVIQTNTAEVKKKVISESTANTVLDMMKSVVSDGTGRYAQVQGYYIAGKTSTAEQGRGNSKTYVASFVALAPARDPQVAILFNLYNPKGAGGHQGGGIAAPVVSKIASEILEYLDVEKDYEVVTTETLITVPDVTGKTFDDATKILTNAGFKYVVPEEYSGDERITAQYPVAGEQLSEKSIIKLSSATHVSTKQVEVPNVKGLGVSNSKSAFNDVNLNMKSTGKGVAIYQEPAAGTIVDEGTIVNVKFGNSSIDVQ